MHQTEMFDVNLMTIYGKITEKLPLKFYRKNLSFLDGGHQRLDDDHQRLCVYTYIRRCNWKSLASLDFIV